eukprot:1860234-Amphidinium_carterae.1
MPNDATDARHGAAKMLLGRSDVSMYFTSSAPKALAFSWAYCSRRCCNGFRCLKTEGHHGSQWLRCSVQNNSITGNSTPSWTAMRTMRTETINSNTFNACTIATDMRRQVQDQLQLVLFLMTQRKVPNGGT